MKKLLVLFVILPFLFSCQNEMKGKKYTAQVGNTCKDGIGEIYTYNILDFDKSTVKSYYKVTAYVSPELKDNYENIYGKQTEIYQWRTFKDSLILKNGKEVKRFKIEGTKLIGYDGYGREVEYLLQSK